MPEARDRQSHNRPAHTDRSCEPFTKQRIQTSGGSKKLCEMKVHPSNFQAQPSNFERGSLREMPGIYRTKE